jgi:hypothetical protein
MKKILFLLLLGLSAAYAIIDERQVDFYYGNGVWNTYPNAEDSKEKLAKFISKDIPVTAPYEVKLNYNYHITDAYDLLEVYYQLQREGQITLYDGFFAQLAGLILSRTGGVLGFVVEELINLISKDVANIENENLDWMVKIYERAINDGHRVILISHSQGNLFGIRAYDQLESWQKKYFKQVSVATPASRVAGGGAYVTLVNDNIIHGTDVILGVPGALAGNARNSQENLGGDSYNHEFVRTYLNGDITQERIKGLINLALVDAQAVPSQWLFEDEQTCSIDGCEYKVRNVTHRYENSLNGNMRGLKVYPFDDNGKLYLVSGGYVKADDVRGDKLEIIEDLNSKICYVLKDVNNAEIDVIDKNESCSECNGTNSTVGFVEVSVAWGNKNADVDLKVNFPNGANDKNEQACLFEHFYSTSDEGVSEGLYPVFVTYSEIVSIIDKWIDDIYITIKVPSKTETRSTNYAELDYLGGHVADIKVYRENSSSTHRTYNGTFKCEDCKEIKHSSCIESDSKKWGSDGSEQQVYGSSSCYVKKNYLYDIIWYISKGILGPLSAADINLYKAGDYDFASNSGSNPIVTAKTTGGYSLLSAGNIPLIKGLDDDEFYVMEIKGGLDIDADDDAVVDDTPTVNLGKIRLVMSGYELNNLSFKVNVLTEIIYQLAKESINEDNKSAFVEKSDDIARCLLKTDMNIDGDIDTMDAIMWTPFYGKDELLNHNYSLYYEPIIDKIHKNQNIYNEALNIYKNPIFIDKTIYFFNNTTVGSAIGKVPYVCGNGVTDYESVNSAYFNIDSNGQIIVIKVPSSTGSYPLHVRMKNSELESVNGTVNIQMVHQNAPLLTKNNFNNAIPDIIADGFDLGKAVIIDEGLSPLTDIRLEGEGADNFEIDSSGHIYVSHRSHIDRKDVAYRLKVFASNEYGESMPVEIMIYVYTEDELVPMVMDTSVGMYGTEIETNKVIGRMKAAENIFCPIIGFQTNSTLFGIQPNGDIYIKAYPSSNDYTIKVYAQSRCGSSNEATLKIDKLNRLIGEIDAPNAKRITLSSDNTKMFVASGKNGVKIMDITNPNTPLHVNSIALDNVQDIVLSADNTKAYIADGESGVKIFDLSNLQDPTLINSITGINAQKISLSRDGSKIYAADKTAGFKIIDITAPLSVHVIGGIDSYTFYDVVQHPNNDNLLLTAGGFGGLKIYDITDAATPVLIGTAETTYAQHITAFNDLAYIADGSGGIRIIDISNTSVPTVIGTAYLPNAYSAAVSNDNMQVYAAGGKDGLFIIDARDILDPIIMNSIDIIDAYSITLLDKSKAYVVSDKGKIFIIAL